MFKRSLIAAAAAAFAIAAPATAQINAQGGLVNVTIQDVSILNNFLNGAQVAALNNLGVPVTVQVPIGVAAAVCDVNANVLAAQKKTAAPTCDAKSGSKALAQNVIKQKLSQKK
jgi:hypothetical protein